MQVEERTLIAIDDSPAAELAFQFYVELFHRPNSSALLLHVLEPHVVSSNHNVLQLHKFREKAAADEKKLIKDLREKYENKMRANGIQGRIAIVYYHRNPGKVICQTAVTEKCSMLLIGYSSKVQSTQVGSVCKYVFRNAPCPIAIVPQRDLISHDLLDSPPSPSSRRSSVVDRPPTYESARRYSVIVPPNIGARTRRLSEMSTGSDSEVHLAFSCPDISELAGGKPIRPAALTTGIVESKQPLWMVTAQVHDSDNTNF